MRTPHAAPTAHASPRTQDAGGRTTIAQDAAGSGQPPRWTATNLIIHWTIAGLLLVQAVTQLGIERFANWSQAGVPPGNMSTALGVGHMVVGSLIFALMVWRIADLVRHGRPPHPPREPKWSTWLATANHWAFYALLLAMPPAGAAAYFLGLEELGEIHGWAGRALAVLVVLHIAGAIAHHVWFKTSVLKRKMPGNGRVPGHPERRPIDADA